MEFSVYLAFNGQCEAAMNFYKDALGAEMKMMQRYSDSPMPHAPEDANLILHSNMEKDGFILMGSDGSSKHPVTFGDNAAISINFHSDEEITRVFNAISAGGHITMPLQDTFWGARFGMCKDKFGTSWMFNWDKPQD